MKNIKGFTIIEVLVTVVIIGLLVAAATINYEKARSKTRDTRRKADVSSIAIAIDSYYAEKRDYPLMGGLTETWSTAATPWIIGLDDYISVLPIEKGPLIKNAIISDYPCDTNSTNKRNYNYFIDDPASPRGYALLARLEIDNDADANTAPRTNCSSTTPIIFGTKTLTLNGYAIYAIYK